MQERPSKTANEKITVKATLKSERFTEKDIVTEIEFPAMDSGLVLITCAFENDVQPLRVDFQFGLEADDFDTEGKKISEIRATKVFWRGNKQELGRHIWWGEAVDLTYTQFVGGDEPETPAYITSFYLTPSMLLEPFQSTERHYQEGVKVTAHCVSEYDIRELPKTRFESHFVYEKESGRAFSALYRLAAVWESDVAGDIRKQTHELEIFLTLSSFAERRKCVCYAVNQFGEGKIARHYRGNVLTPEPGPTLTPNDTLIAPENFRAFMTDCYPRLLASPYGAYLRQAMIKVSTGLNRTLETGFITQFAGLENLLNAYRDMKGKGGILGSEEWKTFDGDLRRFIKGHASFTGEKEKRGLLYEKLGELNRPALAAVLKEFVTEEKINLDGLWPVAEPVDGGVNLYQIRNQIVHGRILPHSGLRALAVAEYHLQWVLERCVLGILKWDVESSRVADRFLQMVGPVAWKDESRLLKTAFRGAEGEADQPTTLFNPN